MLEFLYLLSKKSDSDDVFARATVEVSAKQHIDALNRQKKNLIFMKSALIGKKLHKMKIFFVFLQYMSNIYICPSSFGRTS